MKVRELIEELNKFSPDADVYVNDPKTYHLGISSTNLSYKDVIIRPDYKGYKCEDCERTEKLKLNEVQKVVSMMTRSDWDLVIRQIQTVIEDRLKFMDKWGKS